MADLYDLGPPRRPRGRNLPVLAVIAVAFFLFILYQVAATIQDSQGELERRGLEPGDTIEYEYTARFLDGTLHDTTRRDVAERANRTEGHPLRPATEYGPQRATLNPDAPALGWGAEVEQQVLDAYAGQTLRLTVGPEQGIGDWRPLIPDEPGVPRSFPPQPFFREVFLQEPAAAQAEGNPGTPGFNLSQLEQAIGPVETGRVFNAEQVFPPSWDIVFEDVNRDNRSVHLRHTVQDGQFFDVDGLPGGVTVLIDEERNELTYRLDLDEDSVFVIPAGSPVVAAGFSPGSYWVADQDEETVDLRFHPSDDPDVVGQPLRLEIRILRKI